jgi:hypothetical protein
MWNFVALQLSQHLMWHHSLVICWLFSILFVCNLHKYIPNNHLSSLSLSSSVWEQVFIRFTHLKWRYSKTWLIWNSRDKKKIELWRTSIIQIKKANNLLEKLVLLLSVWYVIACHAIAVTNYHFTLCSVVISVVIKTVNPLSIVF